MKKILVILMILISNVIIIEELYSDDINLIKDEEIIGYGLNNDYYLTKSEREFYAIFKIDESNKFELNLNKELPIYETYFPENEEKFYVISGGNSALDKKTILEIDISERKINWGYEFPGDFITNLCLRNNHLYTALHNNGILVDFNLEEGAINSKRIYEGNIYNIFQISNNYIFVNGTDNYKSGEFKVKILNDKLEVCNNYNGFSDSYEFRHNVENDIFLVYSSNQYKDPDKYIHIFDYSLNELLKLKIDSYISYATFSNKKNKILIGTGSTIEEYSLDGKLQIIKKFDFPEGYERIIKLYGDIQNIVVIIGQSER